MPIQLNKWKNLWLLSLAELLAMSLWFSASAVTPQLTEEWALSGGQQAWLTMSVQIGFVVGALISAALNLADRFAIQTVFALCGIAGGKAHGEEDRRRRALEPLSPQGGGRCRQGC